MQKKLIALAIAGAFVAPAAFADSGNVTIYGKMDMSYDLVDAGKTDDAVQTAGGTAKSAGRTQGINSNTSYIGFKGSEDLGNGLSAIWQVESLVNPDGTNNGTNANMFAGRNSFVGLSGKSWGTFLMGKHDTPYKIATRKFDVFGDGIADNRSIMGAGAASFDGRNNNTMAYVSPNMNGFTVIAGYVLLNENVRNTTNTMDNTQGKAYSLAGIYTNGPWNASLAYERHNLGGDKSATLNTTVDTSEHAWKLGVGYSAEVFDVALAYEKTGDDLNKNRGVAVAGDVCTKNDGTQAGDDCMGHSAWYLSGKYKFGNNAVKLAYTKANDQARDSKTGATQWTLGLDHNFSKRTGIYALYSRLSNDQYGNYVVGGATSATGSYAPSSNNASQVGQTQSAWSFGVRHSF
jgi:predicted porin